MTTQPSVLNRAPDLRPFAEVIVNVPIRRSFRRGQKPPSTELPGFGEEADAHQLSGGSPGLQTFHYDIPPHLLGKLQPGHLVWVPFGKQTLQGVVVRLTDHAPVETRSIDRLARPRPVLTPTQLELAFWIAERYIAPAAEAVKLFLPPGLLRKSEEQPGVQAKREEVIELLIPPAEIPHRLRDLGRVTKQVRLLETLLADPERVFPKDELARICDLRSPSPLKSLEAKGAIRVDGEGVGLDMPPQAALQLILELRGADKYAPVLEALAQAGGPVWKGDLYRQVDSRRAALRTLEQAGLIRISEQVHYRDPLAGLVFTTTQPPTLTGEQEAAWRALRNALFPGPDALRPGRFLLHGVTGSGKTELYLHAIAETLARDRQAIVLVPEIALTPQTLARFAGRFPGRVTVIHSQLGRGERYDVWRRVRDGEIDIVVGPRSALFAPLPRLGLIVIDEEHEHTYKQNTEEWGSFTVFYDARTVARRLAEISSSGLILGSATPSLEAYYEAEQGQITLLELPRRVRGHGRQAAASTPHSPRPAPRSPIPYLDMPPVEIVDMRQELRAGNRSIFSRSLQGELHATLDAGEQAILFLNRRGANTFVMCRDCGHVEECPQCDVPLTYHERAALLICHHCNRRFPIPTVCPRCESKRIKYFGSGTQRIEDLVRQISPRARILRWDADTTGRKGSHARILERFASHEADVLVGTQMIAKGLDLPLVTLVGVISADVGLYLPDFRAPERTFQLLAQVAGRAGRSQRGGRVIFQTYTPDHYAIQAAAEHDYHAFYAREMAFRREQKYPPVGRLARLIFWHKKLETAQQKSAEMAAALRHRAKKMGLDAKLIEILGPAPAFFARHRGYYRWQILVRTGDPSAFLRGLDIPFGWRVDVDPVSLL